MSELTLYLGNKNYSSWSMRAWLALKQVGVPFREHPFDLSDPDVRAAMLRLWPSGKVPALRHGDRLVWDSLAICEYLAESFPQAGLWPADAAARAIARSVSAEMHSGFPDLRREMPFNVRRSSPGKGRTAAALKDIERITAIWRDCRARFGTADAYLFGRWSVADAMFAPVVSRLLTYDVEVDDVCRSYVDAVWARPEIVAWRAAAEAEPMVEPQYDL